MANKRIKDLSVEATSSTLTDNDYAVVDSGDNGTRKTKLSALATWIHNKWASFVHACTAITSFASGDTFSVSNPTDGTRKMSKDTLLTLTSQNALGSIKYLATTKYKGFIALDDADGTGKMDVDTIFNNFAGKFVDGLTPAKKGKFYIYEGNLYKALENYTGVFDDAKFYKVDYASVISTLAALGYVGCFDETITETNKVGLVPDLGSHKYTASSAKYDSIVIQVNGTAEHPRHYNIDNSSIYGCVFADEVPSLGEEWSGEYQEKIGDCTKTYLVIVVRLSYESSASVSVELSKSGLFSDLDALESYFKQYVGSPDESVTAVSACGLVPDIGSHKYTRASANYDSYVLELNGTEAEPRHYASSNSSIYGCVFADELPKYNESWTGEYHGKSGDCNKRYLIVVVSLSDPNSASVGFELGKTGLFTYKEYAETFTENFVKNYVGVPSESVVSTQKINLVPDLGSHKYTQSSANYNSYLVEVRGSVSVPRNYASDNSSIYGCVFADEIPVLGGSWEGEYHGKNGYCDKHYLVIVVKLSDPNSASVSVSLGATKLQNKRIKALFIGNSVTQDHVMYAPWFLKNTYPDLNFKIADYYIGGYTISDYVNNVLDGTRKADWFSIADNTDYWINSTNDTLLDVLQSEEWDLICIQGYYNNSNPNENLTDLQTLVSWLQDNCIAPFKLGWLMHQTYQGTTIFDKIVYYGKLSVGYGASVIFTPAIANKLALQTIPKATLTSDDTHNQEGFPCAMGGYVVGAILAKLCGLTEKIIGNKKRMTSAEHDALHIVGQNGSFQEGTSADWNDVQLAASKAVSLSAVVCETGGEEILTNLM